MASVTDLTGGSEEQAGVGNTATGFTQQPQRPAWVDYRENPGSPQTEAKLRNSVFGSCTVATVAAVVGLAARLLLDGVGVRDLNTVPSKVDDCFFLLAAAWETHSQQVLEAVRKSIEVHTYETRQEEVSSLETALTGMVREQKLLTEDADRTTKEVCGIRVPENLLPREVIFCFHAHLEWLKAGEDAGVVARIWRQDVLAEIPIAPVSTMLSTRRERVLEQYRLFLLSLDPRNVTYDKAKLGCMILEELAVVAILAKGLSSALTKFYSLTEVAWGKKRNDIPAAMTKACDSVKKDKEEEEPKHKQIRAEVVIPQQAQQKQQEYATQVPVAAIQQQPFRFRARGRGYQGGRGRFQGQQSYQGRGFQGRQQRW